MPGFLFTKIAKRHPSEGKTNLRSDLLRLRQPSRLLTSTLKGHFRVAVDSYPGTPNRSTTLVKERVVLAKVAEQLISDAGAQLHTGAPTGVTLRHVAWSRGELLEIIGT